MNNKRWIGFLGAMLMLSFVLSACVFETGSGGPFSEYFVSPTGSDESGDGSEGNPWRTIQHAHDSIITVVGEGDPLRINLARGIYRENLNITRSIILQGVGVGEVVPMDANPDLPTENVSAIWPESPDHTISGDHNVELHDLVFYTGRLNIDGATLLIKDAEFQMADLRHAIKISNSPLARILDTRVFSDPGTGLNYGIESYRSTLVIERSEIGRTFDSAIFLGAGNVVTIQESTIWGSETTAADGIKIAHDNIVNIIENQIIREHPSQPPVGNPGGVDITGTAPRHGLITIRGNEIRGFYYGIMIASAGHRVLVQDNNIAAHRYPVTSSLDNSSSSDAPTVDLGGGSLGSTGGNTISATGMYGFFHQEPWDAMACDNEWNVPVSDIPDRIYDREDDSGLGKIEFEDCSLPRAVTDAAREVDSDESEPTPEPIRITPQPPIITVDTLCKVGPAQIYDTVSAVTSGTEVEILGRGAAANWWVIDNPHYPGVACWVPEANLQVDPDYEYPDTLYRTPPLPTWTPLPSIDPTWTPLPSPQGCLYQGPNDNAPRCYAIDNCPVPFDQSLGACTP